MNREDKKQAALGYVFLLPSLVMFAVFMFYPLFYTLYLSFFEWNMVKAGQEVCGTGELYFRFEGSEYMENLWQYILVHRDSSGV